MATKSKVVEASYRIGCGRYVQENGALAGIADEIARLGCKKPFVMGGERALGLTRETIEKSLAEKGMTAVFYTYKGFCDPYHCDEIKKSADFAGCDVVVGVGGGNIMDAAKYCAYSDPDNMRRCLNVPTSSATCAAVTPLSVLYDGRGAYIRSMHYPVEVSGVIVDMDILEKQPTRLIVSGALDAMAKLPELSQRFAGKDPTEIDPGLFASAKLADFLYDRLNELLPRACVERDKKSLYDIVYYTVCLTGVVSGLARGSNQSALAHKIYENSRSLYPAEVYGYLHGELVAVGLLTQTAYNRAFGIEGRAADDETLRGIMTSYGMPVSLIDAGVPAGEESIGRYYDSIVASSAMAGTTDAEKAEFRKALGKIL